MVAGSARGGISCTVARGRPVRVGLEPAVHAATSSSECREARRVSRVPCDWICRLPPLAIASEYIITIHKHLYDTATKEAQLRTVHSTDKSHPGLSTN